MKWVLTLVVVNEHSERQPAEQMARDCDAWLTDNNLVPAELARNARMNPSVTFEGCYWQELLTIATRLGNCEISSPSTMPEPPR